MSLFLDANVLFTAAHNPKGKAALVIGLGAHGSWALATSTYAREEARRNLQRKGPDSLDQLHAMLHEISVVEHWADMGFPANLVEKDQPIFQAARGWGASHLLTGDLKDFGPFMNQPEKTFGVLIQTVAEFLHSQTG